MCLFKKKIKVDKNKTAPYGSMKYARQTGMVNPVDFYHMRLDYLKNKRMLKQQEKKQGKEQDGES